VRGADVDDVRVTSDTVFQMIEVDLDNCLALALHKQRLQLSHCDCIILGVVKCEVTNLKKGLAFE
jgi:hypothetical protein